jgi:hypothetical protein
MANMFGPLLAQKQELDHSYMFTYGKPMLITDM